MVNKTCIVLSTDEALFSYSEVLLRSISANYSGPKKLDIIILVPRHLLSREHELNVFKNLNVSLRYPNELDDPGVISTLNKMFKGTKFPIASAYRFFLATACPEFSRAVYIDIDCVVVRNLDPVIFFDLGPSSIAAFQEIHLDYADKPSYRDLAYFNSGVFVANLEKWRANNVASRLIEVSATLEDWTGAPDQDVFNVVFRCDWTPLSANFNYLVNIYTNLVMPNPIIVHFAGGKKPWKGGTVTDKWQDLWKFYARQ